MYPMNQLTQDSQTNQHSISSSSSSSEEEEQQQQQIITICTKCKNDTKSCCFQARNELP
jgi:hypothetical protein